MPLTRAALEEIQAECLADDLEIQDHMLAWDWQRAQAYFESGGVDPSLTEAELRAEPSSARVVSSLAVLPPVGCDALMTGEEDARKRGCGRPKPDARVRLFALYGVADNTLSLAPIVNQAPDWLEVRLLELPGHGFRRKERLPPASQPQEVSAAALTEQRGELVRHLADEISLASGIAPFALYGFSFGAVLMYEVVLELRRRGARSPLLLCVAGRGAPHCIGMGGELIVAFAQFSNDQVLEWMKQMGFQTDAIPAAMRPRSAALFRCGMVLGAMPSGAAELPAGSGSIWTVGGGHSSSAGGSHPADPKEALHVESVARITGCRLLSVSGDTDAVWPAELVQRWEDVADAGYRSVRLADVTHDRLMNHRQLLQALFGELAVATAELTNGSLG